MAGGKKTRKYCCICRNFRGKTVDGHNVTLHRYPANSKLRRIWLQRSHLVRKDFVFTKNSQICSQHFVGFSGPSKDSQLPSVFPNKTFKLSTVVEQTVPPEMESFTEEEMEADGQLGVSFSEDFSFLKKSILLHDYCGAINPDTISTIANKCVQTGERLETRSVAVQCNLIETTTCDNPTTQTMEFTQINAETQTVGPELTYEDVKMDKQKLLFYTGIPDSNTFEALFDEIEEDAAARTSRHGDSSERGRPRQLRLIYEFFLILMRLRLGLFLEDLADRFHISTSTCGVIFNKWIDYLDTQLTFLIKWPSRKAVNDHMPRSFYEKYPNCRVIVDCTEIQTETPASLQNKSLMYSDYKSHMTWKALVGISPVGCVTFVSDMWAGSVSDKVITKESGLLELCEVGDAIMADKGFLISDLTTARGIHLIMPPFKQQQKQFSRREVEETRTIANLRIHVERQMERIKNFNILKTCMPITMSRQVSKIWKLCARLTALQPPLCQ